MHLPDLSSIKDLVKKGRDWMNKYRSVKAMESHPYLEQMDILVNIGRNLQVHLDPLGALEDESIKAKNWLEKASRIFLKKNSQLKLCEVRSKLSSAGCDFTNKMFYSGFEPKERSGHSNQQGQKEKG